MHAVEDDALVLRIHSFAEADGVVVLLTRHHGKVRLLAKGMKSIRSRFQGIVSPFNILAAKFRPGQGDRLGMLSGASLRFGVNIAGSSLDKYYFLSCMVEAVLALEIDPAAGDTVFRLLDALIRLTARSGFRPAMLWYFLFWIIRLEGELADPAHCGTCAQPFRGSRAAVDMDPKTLAFQCRACAAATPTGRASARYAAVQSTFLRFLTAAPETLIEGGQFQESFDEVARILGDKIAQMTGKKLHSLNPLLMSALPSRDPGR